MSLSRRLLPLVCIASVALPARAQTRDCPAGTISHVFIDNHSIFDLDEVPLERLEWAYSLANRLHVRTRVNFIRRELLFGVGDCYEPYLLEDSERVLRRLPFISNADVYGVEQPDGSWHVVVDTRDEWSTRPEVTAEFENGIDIRRIALTELNFLGYGATVGAFYRRTDANKEVGGGVATPQFFGTEADFRLGGGKTLVGHSVRGGFTYPFIGEVGHEAWRVFGSLTEDYFDYSGDAEPDPDRVLLPLREEEAEITYARRFGEPGSLTALGFGVSREVVRVLDFPGSVRLAPRGDFGNLVPAGSERTDALQDQTFFGSGTRINLLLGQRNIRFIQRQGLDAIQGVSDVEVGYDVALTLSRTVAAPSDQEAPNDLNTRMRFYLASAPGDLTLVSDLALEGRRIFSRPDEGRTGWRDILGKAELLAYWQPRQRARHTFLGRVSATGGWGVDRPYQLTLGGVAGIRGLRDERFPGGRKLVVNLEDRVYLGWPAPDLFDLGVTLFVDAGQMWAGDVPFGADSGWKGTVGAGLRLGLPAGSQSVARFDIAWPVGGSGGSAGPVFRISLVDAIGLQNGLADPQLDRSRLLGVGLDRFYPRR